MEGTMKKQKTISTNTMVKVAILSAISYILMFISLPIPGIFPDFLKNRYIGCSSNLWRYVFRSNSRIYNSPY